MEKRKVVAIQEVHLGGRSKPKAPGKVFETEFHERLVECGAARYVVEVDESETETLKPEGGEGGGEGGGENLGGGAGEEGAKTEGAGSGSESGAESGKQAGLGEGQAQS